MYVNKLGIDISSSSKYSKRYLGRRIPDKINFTESYT